MLGALPVYIIEQIQLALVLPVDILRSAGRLGTTDVSSNLFFDNIGPFARNEPAVQAGCCESAAKLQKV